MSKDNYRRGQKKVLVGRYDMHKCVNLATLSYQSSFYIIYIAISIK